MSEQEGPRSFAFVFPLASGHINPSLPIARSLVSAGHKVHYLCREQMRQAIEDTGADFHSDVERKPELYEGREPAMLPAQALSKDYGLESANFLEAVLKLSTPALELMLPGLLRWLEDVRADAILYCPLMNPEAALAGKVLGIRSVALLTTAGPGSLTAARKEFFKMAGVDEEQMLEMMDAFQPHLEAVRRLNERYALGLTSRYFHRMPYGYLSVLEHSAATLVTTCEDLQDPMTPELEQAYKENGIKFEAVGALLDKDGACRAAGHKLAVDSKEEAAADGSPEDPAASGAEVLAAVRTAHAGARPVVLVSMGTVITGDHADFGWEGKVQGEGGVRRGLTGRELCQAAWAAAFDAFGHQAAEEGPLLVVALGPQCNALGALKAPANALCAPVMPQVEILKAGVDVFLTHGGQNSFTEALSHGVPLVVCPGFGDQPVNARKAEALGVGLQVPRPDAEPGQEAAAAGQYRAEVSRALEEVVAQPSFRRAALRSKERLQSCGGVRRAVEVLSAAARPADDCLAKGKPAAMPGRTAAVTHQGGA